MISKTDPCKTIFYTPGYQERAEMVMVPGPPLPIGKQVVANSLAQKHATGVFNVFLDLE